MTKQMKAAMAAMLMVGALPMQAQTASTKTTHKKHHKVVKKAHVESETAVEIRELREKQAAQQAQIDALTQANTAANAALAQAQTAAQGAEAQAQVATQQAQSVQTTVQANTDAVAGLKANVTDLQTTNAGLASTISANKVELTEKIESPSTIHYKGVTIKPVAIFMAEGVWRQRAVNSDIATPFNSIPYMGAPDAHTTETNFSARQTRLGGLLNANFGTVKATGYFESDFLGAGTTSNDNQTDSYLFRVRQAFGKIEKGGTAIVGGQMYSLVTEDGKSTDNLTEKLPNSIDPNYIIGWSWARQPGYRVQQKLNPFLTVAASAEEAQIQLASTTGAPANFFFGGPGQTGGLYNSTGNGSTAQTYTTNLAPDVIAKVAFDGPMIHAEVGGLARFFRERLYPAIAGTGPVAPATAGALPYNNTTLGGGAFANVRISPKFAEFAIQGMAGDGTARYGEAQLGDVTVHPNGTLEPVRNYHGLFESLVHVTPKLDFIVNYGGEYNQRTVYATGSATTPFTGYGPKSNLDTGCNSVDAYPGSSTTGTLITPAGACQSPTRYIQEGLIGFQFKPVVNPKYGQILYRVTYEYIERQSWEGITAGTLAAPTAFGSAKAIDNQVHFSMRYYIP